MSRVGKNQNRIRFNFIIKKMVSFINNVKLSQPEFIMKCYDWVEPFAKILEEEAQNEYYAPMLISRGIGNGYPQEKGLECVDLPYGLLNDEENRKKAAEKIRANFEQDISIEQISYINSNMIYYFCSNGRNGFVDEYCNEVENINVETFSKYIQSHLVPALEEIEAPLERFAAILIYAQSGCIPLDVYNRKTRQAIDIYHSCDFHELNDPHFFGDFYGYFRQYQNKEGKTLYKGLVPFKLSIKNEENVGATATLSFSRYMPNMDETPVTMTGKPMMGLETIQIILQAEKGDDTITMSYNWISINNNPLQCRYGVMIARNRSDRSPQLQRFIFFNQPLSKEKEKYIDAYLRLSDDRFIVLEDNLKALPQKTIDFLDKYGKKMSGYVISINQTLDNTRDENLSDKEIVKELFEIKKQSFAPLVINAKEEKQVSDFFRSMLIFEENRESEFSQ